MKNFIIILILFANLNCFSQSLEIVPYSSFLGLFPAGVNYVVKKDGPGFVHTNGTVSMGTYVNSALAIFQTFSNHPLRIGTDLIHFELNTDLNVDHSGYVKLGSDAPPISIFKLTGTTATTEGSQVTYLHGLDPSKILSMKLIIDYSSVGFVTDEFKFNPGYQASLVFNATHVFILNYTANSYNILNKPFKILITYTI